MRKHTNPPRVRHSVRVVVIDEAERVLLFRSRDEHGLAFWVAPGGGMEPGESAEQTARRELWEETGLREVELGCELWRRRGIAAWDGVTYDVRERWFYAHVAGFDVDTSGFTELERRLIHAHRWWSVDELASARDRLVPPNLAELVRGLLHDGPPAQPLDLV